MNRLEAELYRAPLALSSVTDMHDIAVYQQRRSKLGSAMARGVAFIPTAAERFRNRDSLFPFRFDSYFHYLTGFPEPEAVLVLVAGAQPRTQGRAPRPGTTSQQPGLLIVDLLLRPRGS